MDWLWEAIDVVLHLNDHVAAWSDALGIWLYVVLFAVVFAETGLVVTPFLPGDSLLFAVGALAPTGAIDVVWMGVVLTVAAVLGDAVNYAVGHHLGPRVFHSESSRFLNKKHLLRAQAFYERHGGKTIVLARFIPIVRTFAPFVAGIGHMRYARFAMFNIAGAIVWVWSFLLLGYAFGNMPVVKRNFTLVILAIVVLSLVPVAVEYWKGRREARAAG